MVRRTSKETNDHFQEPMINVLEFQDRMLSEALAMQSTLSGNEQPEIQEEGEEFAAQADESWFDVADTQGGEYSESETSEDALGNTEAVDGESFDDERGVDGSYVQPIKPTDDPAVTVAVEGVCFGAQESTKWQQDAFELGVAMWVDANSVSRRTYTGLIELSRIATPDAWARLPQTLESLMRRFESSMPMPPIYQAVVPVAADKQPTKSKKNSKKVQHQVLIPGTIYFHDVINLIVTILNTRSLRKEMHFGMAELVDEPSELWHGQAWAQSILSCSGEFARLPERCCINADDINSPIFPSDCLKYRDPTGDSCFGRVKAVFL